MLRFMTAGESHGKGLVVIVEGLPAGIPVSEDYIAIDMARRQAGYGRGDRMKIERDRAEIISGVRHGLTIGSPVSMLIKNRDWENWKEIMSVSPVKDELEIITRIRPGHADLPGVLKYNQQDIRNIIERASARETAARVAAGSIARSFLERFHIYVHSHTVNIGGHWSRAAGDIDWGKVEASPVRCVDTDIEKKMIAAIDEAKAAGDTLGGIFEVIAEGMPVGLGSHVHWDRKLSGKIGQAVMSINAVKGIEIGGGFSLANIPGSQVHDIIEPGLTRKTNRAGGIEGGMSNGEPIVVRVAVKPIPTLAKPLPSIDLKNGQVADAHIERSDVCVVPAAGVVGEAMLAIVLADSMLEKFGGDHIHETFYNYNNYIVSLEIT